MESEPAQPVSAAQGGLLRPVQGVWLGRRALPLSAASKSLRAGKASPGLLCLMERTRRV